MAKAAKKSGAKKAVKKAAAKKAVRKAVAKKAVRRPWSRKPCAGPWSRKPCAGPWPEPAPQEGRAQEGGLGSASRILGDAANLIVSGIVTTSVVSLVTAMAPCRPVARRCGA